MWLSVAFRGYMRTGSKACKDSVGILCFHIKEKKTLKVFVAFSERLKVCSFRYFGSVGCNSEDASGNFQAQSNMGIIIRNSEKKILRNRCGTPLNGKSAV